MSLDITKIIRSKVDVWAKFWITIHFGKNPSKGGRPPKDIKQTKNEILTSGDFKKELLILLILNLAENSMTQTKILE